MRHLSRRTTFRAVMPAVLLLAMSLAFSGPAHAAAPAAPAKHWAPPPAPKRTYLPDDHVLATVGARKITVYDYRYDYFLSDATLRPSTDSLGRVQFLQDLIDKETLGQAALETGYQFSFEDRADFREYRNTTLSNRLLATTKTATQISDDSLHKVVDYYARELKVRLLFFATREQAEYVRQQLIGGRLTWSVALQRYGLHSTTVINGVSNWLKFANLPMDIGLPVWQLRLGQVSPVIPARSGYHLVQIADERRGPGLPYAAMRGQVIRQLRDIESRKRQKQIQDEAKVGMNVVYDTSNVVYAASFFRSAVHADTGGLGGGMVIDETVPEFSMQDTARTLVTWKGGRLSVANIVHDYSDIQPLMRPSLNTPDNLFSFIDALMLGPRMIELAEKRGLASDSEVVAQLARKSEAIMVTHLVEDSVLSRVQVSKDERRAYYKEHPANFTTFPRVHFGSLVRSSAAAADSTLRMLRNGASFDSVYAVDKKNNVFGSDSGEVAINASNPFHKILFDELRPGKATVVGPDKQKLYAVMYEKSYDPGQLVPYDAMEQTIDETLRNLKGDQAVRAFIAKQAARFPVAAHFDEVMQVNLTDPTLADIE